jgi:predicted anti-sigma-YlaC factor YlaD
MNSGMLACREITELVTDFVEGRLSWWDRVRFQLHVGMCRHCREYLRQMRATQQLIGTVPPQPVPPDVEAELLRRFRDWKKS